MLEGLQKNDGGAGAVATPVQSTKLILNNDYARMAAEFVTDAKSEIRLCAYAWRWYANEPETDIQKFNIALFRACRRGVTVRCLVNNQKMAVYFRRFGFKCRFVEPNRMLHVKAIAIDRKTLVLGSHNLTKRANGDNYEVSIVTQEYEDVAQFSDWFDAMWDSMNES